MNRRFAPLTIALAILLTAGSLIDAQAQSKTSFVDKVEVADEVVTFQTKRGNYADVTMTVAGPDEFRMEQRFSGREMPSLRIKTEKGMTLPDGSYTVEMSARPTISDKQRAALDEARKKGDRYAMRQLMKEIGINPAAMVYSMNVGVAKGMFVNPEGEQEPEGKDMGALHDAPNSTPQIKSVKLTGRRWDAAYRPTAPDVTGTTVQPAALAAEAAGEAPPFAQTSADPAAAWYEATFENTDEDGTPLTYQGFLRPVVTDSQGKLFQIYLRKADGLVFGPWQQGYFQADEGTFRAMTSASGAAAQPFDYVTDEGTEATDASLPFFHIGSGSIDGSLCVGNDCVANEAFGFDTIRMKENNLRLHYEDTSVAAAFPRNDWRVYANDSANGGSSYYGVEDATAGRFVFRVFAGARSNALTVDSQGDVGLGTTTPATDIDIKIGDTPTVRLQQDGTSGFTPQTWDVAGNETNFFIRDATMGSQLPFRIQPGTATNTLYLANDEQIGMGTQTPDANLDIEDAGPRLRLTDVGGTIGDGYWEFVVNNNQNRFNFNYSPDGGTTIRTPFRMDDSADNNLMELGISASNTVDITGDLVISGDCTETDGACADYVFEPDYEKMTLAELAAFIEANRHLPNVPSAAEIEENGVNVTRFTGRLLEKIEELVLYTLEQQQTIDQQQQTLEALLERLEALETGPQE